jgi:hypothetical protein
MNVNIYRDFAFNCGIVYRDAFHINSYQCRVKMITDTDDDTEQNISYLRIRHWISNVLDSAVLISRQSEMLKHYQATGQRVIEMPDEPVDQLMGIMLYLKLNSIMEGRMSITELHINSTEGDHVWYIHEQNDNIGPFACNGWWNESRPACYSSRKRTGKIVSMPRMQEWKDLELDWEDHSPLQDTVVIADFQSHDKK